jgi:hypothetical protein
MTASAQNATTGNITGSQSTQQNDTLTQPGEIAFGALQNLVSTLKQPTGALDAKMAQISMSNDPHTANISTFICQYRTKVVSRCFRGVTFVPLY